MHFVKNIFNSIYCFPFLACISLLCTYSHKKLICVELSLRLFLPPSFLSSDLLFHSLQHLRPMLAFHCSALLRFLEFFSVSPCHQLEVSRRFTQTHKREKWLLIFTDFITFFKALLTSVLNYCVLFSYELYCSQLLQHVHIKMRAHVH